MDTTSTTRQPVVIGGDEGAELHVQVIIGSGRRHLDLRMWRQGPGGFAPTRSALTLDAAETDAVLQGIGELLEASNGGRQVARIVWDKDEGRRLRAETEPFGTRFVARLGLWQRVRDSWKPVGDELLIAAEQLQPLKSVLESLRGELTEPGRPELSPESIASRLEGWPPPGADWLTVEGDRVNFHPRGVRITATVEEGDEEHWLVLRQWRREESLWLPEKTDISLHVGELDALLACLRQFMLEGDGASAGAIPLRNDMWARATIRHVHDAHELRIEVASSEDGRDSSQVLVMPATYLPRFGGMLAQGASILMAHLSQAERASLLPFVPPGVQEDEVEPPPGEIEEIPPPVDQPDSMESRSDDVVEAGVHPPLAPSPLEDHLSDDVAGGSEDQHIPAAAEVPPPAPPVFLGQMAVSSRTVLLYLSEDGGRYLTLQWDGRELRAPMDHIAETLADLRAAYYNALRGRRGHVLTVPGEPQLVIGVHNLSSGAAMTLEHDHDGSITRLAIPMREVPDTLNALEAAIRDR